MIHILLGVAGLAGVGGLLFRIFMPAIAKPIFAAAGAFLGRIPPKGWIAIGIGAALVLGYFVHGDQVKKAHDAAFNEGWAADDAKWQKRFDAMHAAAVHWKSKAEAKAATISTEERASHEQDLHSIASRADDQRMRGPGKAAAPACAGHLDPARLPAAGGGPVAPGGAADAAVAGVPADEPLAIVPWDPLVAYGAEHDALLSEVKAWRDWYARQAELNRQLREGAAAPDSTKGTTR